MNEKEKNIILMSPRSNIGSKFQHGYNCIIEDDVEIGDNVKLGHNVVLKSGTIIKNNVEIGDNCCTTGVCLIGNGVGIRTGAIVSKGVILEDYVFYGPGVVSNHTKHVLHGRKSMLKEQFITYIGFGSVIGSQASLVAGVELDPLTIVGAAAVVTKSLKSGVWVGAPAKWRGDIPKAYKAMDFPLDMGKMYKTREVLDHFARNLKHLEESAYVEPWEV
jgi:acetyltransferase-like isoleucine patch superfamily enzyme